MDSASVKVTFETDANFAAVLNTVALNFDRDGAARDSVNIGEENIIIWAVTGSPGTPYKVSLSTSRGMKVIMTRGRNPESTRISTRLFRAGGSLRFKIIRKDES